MKAIDNQKLLIAIGTLTALLLFLAVGRVIIGPVTVKPAQYTVQK